MEIQVNHKLLKLATALETNIDKVVNEALTLWLKEKMATCPITNQFCTYNGPCNDCPTTNKATLKSQII